MAYTYQNIKEKVFQWINRPSTTYVNDPRISEDVVQGFIHDARRYVADRSKCLPVNYYKNDLSEGVSIYVLSECIPQLKDIYWAGVSVDGGVPKTLRELNNIRGISTNHRQSPVETAGTPRSYILTGDAIVLFPPPDVDITDGLYLNARPHPVRLIDANTVSEMPEEADDLAAMNAAMLINSSVLGDDNSSLKRQSQLERQWIPRWSTYMRRTNSVSSKTPMLMSSTAYDYVNAIALG